MESKTWLAITLCFLIWFGYVKWFVPPPVPVTPEAVTSSTGAPQAVSPQVAGSAASPATSGAGQPTTSQAATASTFLAQTPALRPGPKVSNGKIDLTFSATGGKISEVRTTKYRVTAKKDAELMPVVTPGITPMSLGALYTDPALSGLSLAEYSFTQTGNRVTFQASQQGASVTRDYDVKPGSYFVSAMHKIRVPNTSKKEWGYLLIPVGANHLTFDKNDPLKSWEIVHFQNDKLQRVHAESLESPETISQGATKWVAFGDRYFTTAIVTDAELNPDVVIAKQTGFTGAYLRYPLILKDGQSEIQIPVRFYIGVKDVGELETVPGMRGLIDYGIFSILAYPLLTVLRFFHGFVHNYGVAIILLTILVRLLFYPLSLKSFRSMKAMQKLQPQIATLKEKYKDDMARMNQEQMALFKAHKVNPMGGCLPMLVQLPVFIALYAVLANSIELFQAPFFGWVQDLSVKDPFYIYPVLMGISMFVQQKITPTTGMDPAQAKIMLFMPVIFSFMMVNLPAGLTMYIFVSTLLGIIQQWVMTKAHLGETVSST